MVEVWVVSSWGTLVLMCVLLWRIWIVEQTLHDRVDEIDRSLGAIVGMLIEKLDDMANRAVSITENPLGQLLEFFKQQNPRNPSINSHNTPRGADGQFVEVEANAPKKEEDTKA